MTNKEAKEPPVSIGSCTVGSVGVYGDAEIKRSASMGHTVTEMLTMAGHPIDHGDEYHPITIGTFDTDWFIGFVAPYINGDSFWPLTDFGPGNGFDANTEIMWYPRDPDDCEWCEIDIAELPAIAFKSLIPKRVWDGYEVAQVSN